MWYLVVSVNCNHCDLRSLSMYHKENVRTFSEIGIKNHIVEICKTMNSAIMICGI